MRLFACLPSCRIAATFAVATTLPFSPIAAQEVVEVPLAKATGELREGFKSVRSVHELADGRLLIADIQGGQLRLADLKTGAVEGRLTAGPDEKEYQGLGLLWRWPGDSVAFIDVPKGRLTILTPDGSFARALKVSEPLMPAAAGQPPVQRGPRLPSLRYLVSSEQAIGTGFPPRAAPSTAIAAPARVPYPLIRYNFATASYDTIIQLLPAQQPRAFVISQTVGTLTLFVGTESLQAVDAWAVLSDGTVAIVRAGNYRLDLIAPDGSRSEAGTVAFAKLPVTDADRKRVVSTYKTAMAAQIKSNPRFTQARSIEYTEPTSWPITHPPFRGDAGARVDTRDNLWLATRCAKDEQASCYDVIARTGTRVARVRLPDKTAIVGFGKDVVYTVAEAKGDKLVLQKHALPTQ